MAKVYILQDNPYSPKNFISAEEYGELVFLFNHHIANSHIPKCVSQLWEKFRDVESDDWLIPTGHPALIAAAGHVWREKTGGFNMLIWDRQSARYQRVEL